MTHLPSWRLFDDPLTPEEEAHVARCLRCRGARQLGLHSLLSGSTRAAPHAVRTFALGHQIGRSGTGITYAARDTATGEWVSVRMVFADEGSVEELLRHILAHQEVVHPAIVPVREVMQLAGGFGVVSEPLEGPTLADLLAVYRPDRPAAEALIAPLVDAAEALRAAGLAHRALVAENVHFDAEGRPRLADAGLAPYLRRDGAAPLDDAQGLTDLWRLLTGEDELPAALPPARPGALAEVARVLREIEDRWGLLAQASPGRYRRHHPIAHGGFGYVYRAWDVQFGADVALKMLLPDAADRVDELVAEFRRAADLLHPNLVMMYDLVIRPDITFFTMELVVGDPLEGPADEATVRSGAAQLFDALAALHEAGLVHRDVKPSNVLREVTGRVVLVDFGLARESGRPERRGGTHGFMAPEVADGRPIDPAVDMYAAGQLLLEFATGARWTAAHPPAPADLQGLPPELVPVVARCLSHDPTERPTAAAAREALGPYQAPPPRVLPPPEPLFVGRADEVEAIRSARAPLVRVEGPPGIGKTRLVRQALGPLDLTGRSTASESVPFGAFDRIFARLQIGRAELAQSTPTDLAQRLIERWLEEGGAPMWLDDVQWIDDDSLAVLRALLRAEARPTIVASHRPLPEGHPLADDPAFAGAPVVRVGPLSAKAVEQLGVELALTGASAEAIARCGGNPVALQRLAQRGEDGSLLAAAHLEAEDHEVATRALSLVALHGAPVPMSALAQAVGGAQFPRVFTALVKANVLTRTTYVAVDFAHDGERDEILGAVPAPARPPMHARLAAVFAASPLPEPAAIARHWYAAGERERARGPALEAAALAERTGAWSRAVTFWRIATDDRADLSPGEARAKARALAAAGYTGEAGRLLRERGVREDQPRAAELLSVAALLREADALVTRALAERGIGRPASWLGLMGRGLTAALRVGLRTPRLSAAWSKNDAEIADLLWTITGPTAHCDPVRSFAYTATHLRYAMMSGDPARAARAMANHLIYAEGAGVSAAWVAARDRDVDALAARADRDVMPWIHASRGYRHFMNGEFVRAVEEYGAVERLLAPSGASRWERVLAWTDGLYCLGYLGRHAEMAAGYAPLAQRFRELGDVMVLSLFEAGAGYYVALTAGDDPGLAERRLGESERAAPNPPFTYALVQLVARVQLDLYTGHALAAHARVCAAWGTHKEYRFRLPQAVLWYLWGLTGAAAGEVGPAALRRAARRLRGIGTPYALVRAAALDRLADPALAEVAREVAARHGEPDFADAAAAVLGDVDGALDRIGARGVRAPERWLRLFGVSAERGGGSTAARLRRAS